MIEITFTATRKEYIEAQLLHTRRQPKPLLYLQWLVIVVMVASVILVDLFSPDRRLFAILLAACLVSLIISYAINPWIRRHNLSKRYAKEKRMLTDVRMQISVEGLQREIPNIGRGFTEWQAYSSWLEGPSVFILLTRFTFRLIPKRCLKQEEQNELRQLLIHRLSGSD